MSSRPATGDRQPAIARLLAAGFTPDAAEVAVEALRPAVGIGFEQQAVPLGGSKIGGRPHVWQDFVWPGDLAFVAQINFAECKPFDPAYLSPSVGIMYLFSTCDEEDVIDGGEDAFVVRYCRGPLSDLTVHPFPDALDKTEGQFVERRMMFTPSYVLVADDELDTERPRGRDEDILAAVGGAHIEARMLGRPDFFRPELDGAFDPGTDTLLLALPGTRLWRGADDRASIYGDGEFFVTISTDALRNEKIENAWVLFEAGT